MKQIYRFFIWVFHKMAPCKRWELLKFKLTNHNSARGPEKLCYPTSLHLFAITGPENHLKGFVATFLSTSFGAKTGLLESGDSNDSCLTNRFHVAVRLFSNRSQMTSKCGKNKKVAHEAIAECVTDVLTTFWRLLWSITEQTHGNMESICFI